ncbi:hypothetical protein [Persephonella sp.]
MSETLVITAKHIIFKLCHHYFALNNFSILENFSITNKTAGIAKSNSPKSKR